MKKMLTLVLALVMLFSVCSVDAAAADGVEGVWKAVAGDKLRDGREMYFCFVEGIYYQLTISENFEDSGAVPKPYRVEADSIVVGDNGRYDYLAYKLDGDSMTLWVKAREQYELVRVDDQAELLIGEWEMSDASGDWDELPEKAYLVFTENEVALGMMMYEEIEGNMAYYYVYGPVVDLYNYYSDYQENQYFNGDDSFIFELEGDTLTIGSNGCVMCFTRRTADPSIVPLAQQVIGAWEVVEPEDEELQVIFTGKTMGAVEMIDGTADEMSAWHYIVAGDMLLTADEGWTITIEGNMLTMVGEYDTLVLTRMDLAPSELAEQFSELDLMADE